MSDECGKAFEKWLNQEGRYYGNYDTMHDVWEKITAWSARGNGWVSVKDGLPETCAPVLAYGLNGAGKGRRLRAMFARRFELEAYDNDELCEYSEEKDCFYAPEGWYENNEFEEVHWGIEFPVTHWQPLPEPPKGGS